MAVGSVLAGLWGNLGRRFGILLALLALLSAVPWVLSDQARRHLDGAGARVDAAGSLRYRLVRYGLEATTGHSGQLEGLASAQRATLRSLLEGDEAAGLPACRSEATCERLRRHRDRFDRLVVPAAEAALAGSSATELREVILSELEAVDGTVRLMAEEAQGGVDWIGQLGLGSAALGLVLLLVVGLSVWEVFSHIRAVHAASLAPEPEGPLLALARGRDEVAQLAGSLARSIARLRQQEEIDRERIQQILGAAPEAMLVLHEGEIEYGNARAGALFQWAPEELVGKTVEALVPRAPAAWQALLRDGDPTSAALGPAGESLETEGVRRDGSAFTADVVLSPVRVRGRSLFIAIVRDVTAQREAERRLAALRRHLERANAELGERNAELEQFAFVASHDLQEPLRKIVAFGDRLEAKCAGGLSEQGRDYLARMQDAAKRMQKLIEDLLTWSRLTTRALPYEDVDLGLVVRQVLGDLEVAVEKAGGQIEVGDLGTVEADPTQMRQLFQNLLGNALKYRRPDTAPVVRVSGAPEDGGGYRVTVRDNGIGFEQRHADRIFTIFERLHSRAEYEGTGIGLAICRKIVLRHGGRISVESAPGQGAAFTFTLPSRQLRQEAS